MKIECEGARGRRRKKEREREGKEVGRRRDRGSEG